MVKIQIYDRNAITELIDAGYSTQFITDFVADGLDNGCKLLIDREGTKTQIWYISDNRVDKLVVIEDLEDTEDSNDAS